MCVFLFLPDNQTCITVFFSASRSHLLLLRAQSPELMSPKYKTNRCETRIYCSVLHWQACLRRSWKLFLPLASLSFILTLTFNPLNSHSQAYPLFLFIFSISSTSPPSLCLSHTLTCTFSVLMLPVFGHRGAEWWTLLVRCKRPASISLSLSVATVL